MFRVMIRAAAEKIGYPRCCDLSPYVTLNMSAGVVDITAKCTECEVGTASRSVQLIPGAIGFGLFENVVLEVLTKWAELRP